MRGEEDGPRRPIVHQIGEKLDNLSVHELDERIAGLQAEIERLDAARRLKRAALESASSVFGKRTP